MSRRPRPVLVVCHEASRTGGPRVAVDVLNALRGPARSVVCVLRWPGPLQGELGVAADRLLLEPLRRSRRAAAVLAGVRAGDAVGVLAALLVLVRVRPAVVYLNTLVSAVYLGPCRLLGVPVVLHAHEVPPFSSHLLARHRVGTRLSSSVALAACSGASAAALRADLGVDEPAVQVLPSVPDHTRIGALADARTLGDERPVVGLCGTVDARKGADLWARAALQLAQRGVDARFVWVGGDRPPDAPDDDPTEYLGATDNPYPWLRAFDVLVLASRADAFPLVVLEAMLLGTPVVAFDIGGVREQVGDTGVLVAPEDPEALADAVEALLADPERLRALGAAAQQRVRERYPIEAFHASVRALVERALAGSARG